MRNLKSVLAVLLMAGVSQIALAKPIHVAAAADADVKTGVQVDTDKGHATENMSTEGSVNANSPAVGQEKGQDRAAERKAIDHEGKHKAKGKLKSGTSADTSTQN